MQMERIFVALPPLVGPTASPFFYSREEGIEKPFVQRPLPAGM